MLRKLAALAILAGSSLPACAATYDCFVKRIGAKTTSSKALWSGKIKLDDDAKADAQIFIIDKSGAGISLADIVKNSGDNDAIRAALKRYDGRTVVGLRRQSESLDLNLGHVDTANKQDPAPMDADAWVSPDAKMIGVTDVRAKLMASCRLAE